jgi:hypothetical protein
MSMVRYINGCSASQITPDFTRYERFAPRELFEPPDEPSDPLPSSGPQPHQGFPPGKAFRGVGR